MTVLTDRPLEAEPLIMPKPSARPAESTAEAVPAEPDPPELATPSSEEADQPEPSPEQLQAELEERQRSVEILGKLTQVEDEGAFLQRRGPEDARKDENAARRIRDRQRRERERAERAAIRARRVARVRARWDDRAERVRQRIMDPARQIGSIHRTWTFCAAVMILIIGGALAYMTHTVKLGVAGEDGTWLAYAIEPIASAMLVVSLAVQTQARRNGQSPGRGMVVIDVALCAASIAFVVIPWGVRYGWDPAETLVHLVIPLLVTGGVVLWHQCADLVSRMLARAKEDPAMAERLQLLRTAIANGELDPNPSKNRVEKYLREALGGIGRPEADKTARTFLGR